MTENRIHFSRFILALVCLATAFSATASAGIRVGIGFGTTLGPHRHHHHGWYGGWHAWPDYYWYDPWYEPWPVVVVPPVVTPQRRVVIEERQPAPPMAKVERAEPLSERQLQNRSELLKILKIGDADNRAQAVWNLEPFARDQNVRTALEQVLSKDRDPQVRKAVAELFSRLRDPKTVPTLKQAYAEDEDRNVQQAAYKALVMIEGYNGL